MTKLRMPFAIVKRDEIESLKNDIELHQEEITELYQENMQLRKLRNRLMIHMIIVTFAAGIFFTLTIYFATRKRGHTFRTTL